MKKILVVDDEQSIREIVRMVLEGEGYDVLEAEDGFVAYKAFIRHRPDLILTDIKMPGASGLEFVSRLKREFPEAKTKIVVMSGGGAGEDDIKGKRRKALEIGADDFMEKPFELNDLRQKISRLLRE